MLPLAGRLAVKCLNFMNNARKMAISCQNNIKKILWKLDQYLEKSNYLNNNNKRKKMLKPIKWLRK